MLARLTIVLSAYDALSETVFFFNDTATTEIYTLSLHDALPILADNIRLDRLEDGVVDAARLAQAEEFVARLPDGYDTVVGDRKSTRLNSSHANISYAVFCLKKKKTTN